MPKKQQPCEHKEIGIAMGGENGLICFDCYKSLSEIFQEIRKETLEAVLPKKEQEKGYWAVPFVCPDSKIITHQEFYQKLQENYDNSKIIGFNVCYSQIIQSAKAKFNIDL